MGPLGQVAVIVLGLAFAYACLRFLGKLHRKERAALADGMRRLGFEPSDPDTEPSFSDKEVEVLYSFDKFGFRGPYDTFQDRDELNIVPIVIGRRDVNGAKQVLFRFRTKGGRSSVKSDGLAFMIVRPGEGSFHWVTSEGFQASTQAPDPPGGDLASRFELAEELNAIDWSVFTGHATGSRVAEVEISPAGRVFASSCVLARSLPLFFEMTQRAIALLEHGGSSPTCEHAE